MYGVGLVPNKYPATGYFVGGYTRYPGKFWAAYVTYLNLGYSIEFVPTVNAPKLRERY